MSPFFQPIQLQTPLGAQKALAGRARVARVEMGLKQSTPASRAGVTLASPRRFEQTGEVSLKHLMRICHALGRIDEFDSVNGAIANWRRFASAAGCTKKTAKAIASHLQPL